MILKRPLSCFKSKKAPGPDRIRSEMLKSGIHILAPSSTKLFNFLLKTGNCLDAWSSGLISLIFKSGVSCLGKLFCSPLNKQLCNFVEANNLIHSSQIGFINGFRTTDPIFSLRTLIDKYVVNANKGKLYCCFVDFQKALDSVWHNGLYINCLTPK